MAYSSLRSIQYDSELYVSADDFIKFLKLQIVDCVALIGGNLPASASDYRSNLNSDELRIFVSGQIEALRKISESVSEFTNEVEEENSTTDLLQIINLLTKLNDEFPNPDDTE